MSKSKQSPAMHLILHVHEYQGHQQSWSSDRMWRASCAAISLAVEYGLEFARDDFKSLARFIVCSGESEGYYAVACGSQRGLANKSAALSFESWTNRKPFLVRQDPKDKTPRRVYVGCKFQWYGVEVTCTSFNDEGHSFIACTYKERKTERGFPIGPEKIARRHTITHQEVRDYHAAVKGWDALCDEIDQSANSPRAQIVKWMRTQFPNAVAYSLTVKQIGEVRAKLQKLTEAA